MYMAKRHTKIQLQTKTQIHTHTHTNLWWRSWSWLAPTRHKSWGTSRSWRSRSPGRTIGQTSKSTLVFSTVKHSLRKCCNPVCQAQMAFYVASKSPNIPLKFAILKAFFKIKGIPFKLVTEQLWNFFLLRCKYKIAANYILLCRQLRRFNVNK